MHYIQFKRNVLKAQVSTVRLSYKKKYSCYAVVVNMEPGLLGEISERNSLYE